ncbi:MAG TPA: alpha/beta hydrolase [Myxococcales bacterium]|nr:alpha/beta hydrolase [Myxococcales bacterium]
MNLKKETMKPTLLFVPGLRDHVEEHWQTILARKIEGACTVPPLERNKLSRVARVAALEGALDAIDGPVVLVAHSAGVMITVHWAAQSGARRVLGALLAAPADLESPLPQGYPSLDVLDANGWLPVPRQKLPFPAIVAASTNDPLGRLDRIEGYAKDWGARLVDAGAVGHLNPAAGFGEWKLAETLLQELGR